MSAPVRMTSTLDASIMLELSPPSPPPPATPPAVMGAAPAAADAPMSRSGAGFGTSSDFAIGALPVVRVRPLVSAGLAEIASLPPRLELSPASGVAPAAWGAALDGTGVAGVAPSCTAGASEAPSSSTSLGRAPPALALRRGGDPDAARFAERGCLPPRFEVGAGDAAGLDPRWDADSDRLDGD